jgi:hypothetical protein
MSLEKTTSVDQITVTENGIVLYREAICIIENGKEISKTYRRTSLPPGQDLAGQPENVVTIARAAWTPEVIDAFNKAVAESLKRAAGGQA